MLWGIAGGSPETALGEKLYYATLILAGGYFVVAVIAIILSFVCAK